MVLTKVERMNSTDSTGMNGSSKTSNVERMNDTSTSSTGGASVHSSPSVISDDASSHGGMIKMDKYGFLLDDVRYKPASNMKRMSSTGSGGGSVISDADSRASSAASSRRSRNSSSPTDAKRWEELLNRMHPSNNANYSSQPYANIQSKVKRYARRGLPDDIRQKAWVVLTGVDLLMKEHFGEYENLVDQAEEEWIMYELERNVDQFQGKSLEEIRISRVRSIFDTIERDIHRTFPKHYLFNTALAEELGNSEHKLNNLSESGARSNNKFNESPGGGSGSSEGDESSRQMAMRLGINVNRDDTPKKPPVFSEGVRADSESIGGSDDEDEDDEGWFAFSDDNIASMAESMGTDAASIVEDKKRMFNEGLSRSMKSLMDHFADIDFSDVEESDDESTLPFSPFASFGRKDSNVSALSGTSTLETMGVGEGQDALRRVLRAYSLYDSDIGYCQGMNFITAMFLTFLPEEEAFWLLVVVMNDEPYKLRELFAEDMRGTHEVLYLAEKLLAQFLPKLSKHLEAEGIHISMFVTQWLLTVFTSTFPFDLVARVWDSFLVEGWKVVYRVMLALLEHASDDMLTMRFEEILGYIKDFPSSVGDGKAIMDRSLKIALKGKHIQKHVTEWRRHASDGERDNGSKTTGGSKSPRKPKTPSFMLNRGASDDHSDVSSMQNTTYSADGLSSSQSRRNNAAVFINAGLSSQLCRPLQSALTIRTLHESLHRGKSSAPALKPSVSFTDVSIREYERILGDNPSVTSGAPIGIGWKHAPRPILVSVDNYEKSRERARSSIELVLDQSEREMLLKEHTNATHREVVAVVKAIRKEKAQRLKTVVNLGMMGTEEKMEAAKRKAQRMLNKSQSYETLEAKLWQDAHVIAMQKAGNIEDSIRQGRSVSSQDLYSVGTPCLNAMPSRRNSNSTTGTAGVDNRGNRKKNIVASENGKDEIFDQLILDRSSSGEF